MAQENGERKCSTRSPDVGKKKKKGGGLVKKFCNTEVFPAFFVCVFCIYVCVCVCVQPCESGLSDVIGADGDLDVGECKVRWEKSKDV